MVLDLLPLLDRSTSCVRNWPSTSAKYMNREYMEFSSVLDNIEMFKVLSSIVNQPYRRTS